MDAIEQQRLGLSGMVVVRIAGEEHVLDWSEWETWVRTGRVPPDALVRADAISGDAFVRADSLESYASLRDDRFIAFRHAYSRGAPPIVTALIVGVQIRIWWFLWTSPISQRELVRLFTNWASPALEDGQTWRLVTMGLLHEGFLHILFNMVFLAYAGWNLERALGHANLCVLYFMAVIGGSLLSMFGSPGTMSLGASGGVFGLISAAVVFGLTRPTVLPERGRYLLVALLPYLVVMFTVGLMSAGTDNWSHLGGLLTGAFLALVLDPVGLQRQRGWNRAVHGVCLASASSLLLALAWAGPYLYPLADSERVREWHAREERQTPLRSDVDPGRSWRVPIGWRPRMNALDEPGFGSPVGPRHFAVRHDETATPTDVDTLRARWQQRLESTAVVESLSAPLPALVGSQPGQCVRATIVNPPRHLEWCGAARGLYTLTTVWEVDEANRDRLEPLHRRLAAAVRWDEPRALADAREQLASMPDSLRNRASLAKALAEVGEVDEALDTWRLVLADEHHALEHDRGAMETTLWYPDAPSDLEPLWSHVLGHRDPELLVALAQALEEHGRREEAIGLLEVAWLTWPGDRALKRARRSRDLPTWLDPDTNQPWDVLYDAESWTTRSDGDAEPPPLDLESAANLGRRRAERVSTMTRLAVAALDAQDPAALRALVWLKYGYPPPASEALEGLLEDARTVELGGRPSWLPQALADRPLRPAEIEAMAPEAARVLAFPGA